MNLKSETMKTLYDAFLTLSDENNSGQYLRECSRTTDTPYRLHDMFEDLNAIEKTAVEAQSVKSACLKLKELL